MSLEFSLIERFASTCRHQAQQSYRVRGLWLPVCFGTSIVLGWLWLPQLWLPASIALFVVAVFSSFSRYKAKQLQTRPGRVLLVRVLDKQLLGRGHWRADGLVYPVEVEVHYQRDLRWPFEGEAEHASTPRSERTASQQSGSAPRPSEAELPLSDGDPPRHGGVEASDEGAPEGDDASATLRSLAPQMSRCRPHKYWLWLELSLVGRVREGYGLLAVLLGDERVCGIVVDDRLLVAPHRVVDPELREHVEVVGAK